MEIIQIRNIKQASGFPLLLKATTSKRQFIYELGVQVCNMIFNGNISVAKNVDKSIIKHLCFQEQFCLGFSKQAIM